MQIQISGLSGLEYSAMHGGGYSAILSGLQKAKQDLSDGNYGLEADAKRTENINSADCAQITDPNIINNIKLDNSKTVTLPGETIEGWQLYQQQICKEVDQTADRSGISGDVAHSLGLDQSFDSIGDFINAISNVCLDIKA